LFDGSGIIVRMVIGMGMSPTSPRLHTSDVIALLINFMPQLICIAVACFLWFKSGLIAKWMDGKQDKTLELSEAGIGLFELMTIGCMLLGIYLLIDDISKVVTIVSRMWTGHSNSSVRTHQWISLPIIQLIISGIRIVFALYLLKGAKGLCRFLLRRIKSGNHVQTDSSTPHQDPPARLGD
tara:strand:- start:284 stop:826 length:543 start_codon:yes stop_codon:yes gene_type:complete